MRSSIPLQNAMAASERLSLESMIKLNEYLTTRIGEKREDKAEFMKQCLGYGDNVSWVDVKTGVRTHGEIVKVGSKYAKVNVPGGPFGHQVKVPLDILERR